MDRQFFVTEDLLAKCLWLDSTYSQWKCFSSWEDLPKSDQKFFYKKACRVLALMDYFRVR